MKNIKIVSILLILWLFSTILNANKLEVNIVKIKNLTDIPLGARKIVLDSNEYFIYKNKKDFQFYITKGSFKNFEANVSGVNYTFYKNKNKIIAQKAPERQSQFGINYDRMTRGNSIIKNIMLSAEARLAEYFKEVKWYNKSQISDELSWIARLFWRDTIDRITFEDFRAAYPEILTSLSYLDQNRFPNLYKIGLTESNLQQSQIIAERADNAVERADRLESIINKLTSNN